MIHAQFVAYFWAMQHIRKAVDAMILLPGAFMSQWMLHFLKMSFSFKHLFLFFSSGELLDEEQNRSNGENWPYLQTQRWK